MKLRDMLENKSNELHRIDSNADLATAARLLSDHHIGALAVVGDDGALRGILSERDISKALGSDGAEAATKPVSSAMTSSVITCSPDHGLKELFRSMVDNNIRHLPIVDNDKPVGMVSIRDISRTLFQKYESDIQDLKDLIIALDIKAA